MATKILDLDLADRPADVQGLFGYRRALALVRWRGIPLGEVELEIRNGNIAASDVWRVADERFHEAIAAAVLDERLPKPTETRPAAELPAASVVVCTRDRPDDLRGCLASIFRAADGLAGVDVIVVDNAPTDEQTRRVVEEFPARYVREDRQGLNWARSCGARMSQADVVVYTDDDAVVDLAWINQMRRFFEGNVAAVTGLVMPQQLDTPAQELFEVCCGFPRHFQTRRFTANAISPVSAAQAGAGVSMAIRRRLILEMGLFDNEMDCGTPTRSGGDHYAFYRLLKSGWGITYNPRAISWHRHRATLPELQATLSGYSTGVYCFLLRCLLKHGEMPALSTGLRWFVGHHLFEFVRAASRPRGPYPLSLILAEIRGVLAAPRAYLESCRRERAKHNPARTGRPVGVVA